MKPNLIFLSPKTIQIIIMAILGIHHQIEKWLKNMDASFYGITQFGKLSKSKNQNTFSQLKNKKNEKSYFD